MAKKKGSLLLVAVFLAACSAETSIDHEQVTLTDHRTGKHFNLSLTDDGGLIKEEIESDEELEEELEAEAEVNPLANLDQAQAELESRHYDAAAGSLTSIIAVSEDNELAPELLQEVRQAQVQEAESFSGSQYYLERQSELIANQYDEETGQAIDRADDAELEDWLLASDFVVNDLEAAGDDERRAAQAVAEELDFDLGNLVIIIDSQGEDPLVEIRQVIEEYEPPLSDLIGVFKYEEGNQEIYKLNLVNERYERI